MLVRPILLLLMLTAPPAFAQLHWPTLQVEREAEAQAAAASGSFAFTNVSNQPITITQVRTSCGCPTAGSYNDSRPPFPALDVFAPLDPSIE